MQVTSVIVGLWNHRVIKQQKGSHVRERWRDFHMYRLVHKKFSGKHKIVITYTKL